jgi:aconitate decarboxylase
MAHQGPTTANSIQSAGLAQPIGSTGVTNAAGPTGRMATWLAETILSDIPPEVRKRAHYLLLDGVGCLLVGAQLPWSKIAVEAVTGLDGGGNSMICGWGRTTSAPSAAMLNSSFIQGFELDDYFPAAPLHANSLVLPAMMAVVGQRTATTGPEFLLAAILGYEVGPRVGLALHGGQMLSRGWHSGVVFGPAAAAAAAGSLYGLTAAGFEDALGIAVTQSCGLMAAQFESMVKRMQHGFASRNGLYAAALASAGYVGIKQVFEREYGGFLSVFGEGHDPDPTQISAGLGTRWDTLDYGIKPYAAMGGLHAAIDATLALQAATPIDPTQIRDIRVDVSDGVFKHGGFDITRPLTPITAQLSLKYTVPVVLLDQAALVDQYRPERINRDDVWDLVARTQITHDRTFDRGDSGYTTRVTITTEDNNTQSQIVERPRGGLDNPLSNDEIVTKYRMLTEHVVDHSRRDEIQHAVLTMEDNSRGPRHLQALLTAPVRNVLS